MQTCVTCCVAKPLEGFYPSCRGKRGTKCRVCSAEYAKEYYRKNKEKFAEYVRKWKRENVERWKRSRAAYRERNRDRLREYNTKYQRERRARMREAV